MEIPSTWEDLHRTTLPLSLVVACGEFPKHHETFCYLCVTASSWVAF
jgi:hypothetical protein